MEDSVYEAVGSIGGVGFDDGIDVIDIDFPEIKPDKPKTSNPCLLCIEIFDLLL